MSKRNHFETLIGIAALLALLLPSAAAAAQRTFVSAGSGIDSNPCSRQFPCRQFPAALVLTDAGGEVVVLDSGGYGQVTINQSVTIAAPGGVHGAITAFSEDAISIDATASDVVILRGLYLNGLGAVFGINFRTGQTLHVENSVLSGFSGAGAIAHSPGADVYIKNTVSRQNAQGYAFFSLGSPIRASLTSVRAMENILSGVEASANSLVTVTRGFAAGNTTGFRSQASSGVINVESSTTTFNTFGAWSNGTVRVANSMITGNGTGVANGPGASTISFGNNRLAGNTSDGVFTSTILLK